MTDPLLVLRREAVQLAMRSAGIPSWHALGARMTHVSKSQAHRVLTGEAEPGPRFIADLLTTLPGLRFEHAFSIKVAS